MKAFQTLFLFFLILPMLLTSCTQRQSDSGGTGNLVTGDFLPFPSAGPDYSIPVATTPCLSSGITAVVQRISPVGDVVVGQPIMWTIQVSGCSEYRIIALNGSENDPVDFSGSMGTIPLYTKFSQSGTNISQLFLIQGINSAGYTEQIKQVSSESFDVVDSLSPPVPAAFACQVQVLGNDTVYIPVDSMNRPLVSAPVFDFRISNALADSVVESIQGPQASYQVVTPLNHNASAEGTEHLITARVEAYGYVPIKFNIAAASNRSIKKQCQTLVAVLPQYSGPPLPPPTAPTCTIAATPNVVELGQSVTVKLTPTGFVDEAYINGGLVDADNAQVTYTPTQVGTINVTGRVKHLTVGESTCTASYEVRRKRGILAKIYNFGSTSYMPNFNNLTPVAEKVLEDINMSQRSCHATYPGFEEYNFKTYYGVRNQGFIQIDQAGTYSFRTLSDDGVNLFINGQTIINNPTQHAPTYNTGSVYLAKGEHPFLLDWYQGPCDLIAMQLSWQKPGDSTFQIVPKAVFSYTP